MELEEGLPSGLPGLAGGVIGVVSVVDVDVEELSYKRGKIISRDKQMNMLIR